VRDEVVSLQEHPSKYVPEVSALDPRITLHQLLTHTSGLADIYAVRNVRIEMAALVERSDRLIDYLASLPQVVEPGSAWRYSSTGYLVLAYLLERIVGSSYETLLHEKLLTPLGLADTGVDDPCRVNYGRASGHIGRDGSWQNAPNDALAEVDGPRELYSTAADLDRWASALLDGRVLDAAGVELTFSPHARVGPGSDFDPNLSYGYGWFLGPTYRWIGGVTGGFRAALWQYPSERLNVVMLWNNETVNSHRLFAALRPVLLG